MAEQDSTFQENAVGDASPAHAVEAETASAEDVPAGYKRTEVGVIPEDWRVCKLRELLRFPPSYGINAAAVQFDDSLPAYIRITDIDDNGLFYPDPPVSVWSHDVAQYFLRSGDVVFARTGASVGKSYEYKLEDGPLVYAGFLIRVSPDSDHLNSTYLANYCRTQKYWDWVKSVSLRSGQPGINGSEYGSLTIPTPSISEQLAIATALSDADALIVSLDRLIAKKRAIKQAAMQQLLTGQTRLPGFTGEWETKRLGDIGYIVRGVSYASDTDLEDDDTSETVRLLRANNLQDRTVVRENLQFVHDTRVAQAQYLKEGDIVICMANGSRKLVGKTAVFSIKEPVFYTFGAFMAVFRALPDTRNSLFIAYLFQCQAYRNYINVLLAGSSINNLKPSDLEGMEFSIPTMPEQIAIATVLADMDADIEALEHRRDKARQIKQGMMQQLLTGRVRLVAA